MPGYQSHSYTLTAVSSPVFLRRCILNACFQIMWTYPPARLSHLVQLLHGRAPARRCLLQGFDITNFVARMQAMARPAYNAICNHAAGQKPALVFVPTRKHAKLAALDLLTFAAADG